MKEKTTTAINLRALCEAAILIAIATVIALIPYPPFRFDLWGNGGSVDFVMVPLFILCWRRGPKWAVPACFAFGFIKCLVTGGIGYGLPSILLDYVAAYGAVSVASLFSKLKGGLFIGAAVGSLARFAVHFISGVTIYKLATADTLFGMNFDASTAALYSLVYNGSFMLGETVFCFVILALLWKPLEKLPK